MYVCIHMITYIYEYIITNIYIYIYILLEHLISSASNNICGPRIFTNLSDTYHMDITFRGALVEQLLRWETCQMRSTKNHDIPWLIHYIYIYIYILLPSFECSCFFCWSRHLIISSELLHSELRTIPTQNSGLVDFDGLCPQQDLLQLWPFISDKW